MSFDPYNRPLKIWKSIRIPTPKMGAHLRVWGFIPSHFPTFLGAWNVTPKLHSWLTPLQTFTLVVSSKLGLWHHGFLEDLMLFMIKRLMPMRIIESIWLQRLTHMLCLWLVYTPKKTFVEKVLLSLVEKIVPIYVQLALVDYLLIIYNFDLWMSKGVRDVFVVVVSFISND